MATPIWTPSTFYATGSLVQPATTQPSVPTPIPNPSFESGNVEWTLDAGLSIVNGVEHFGPGTWSLQANTGFAGERWAEMQDFIDCVTGESITARCQIQQGASSFGNTGGAVGLRFYDSLNALISDSRGNEVIDGSGGAWHQSSVTASAPAGTAFVRIYIYMKRVNQNLPFWADAVEWNKISQAQSGLIFRAVQPTVGLSGSVEPVWPLVNGAQVIDNEVIWEAVLATRVTWEAHAILVSGATEPVFPAQEGGTVGDNTIAWRAVSRRVTDPNCPNSKRVIIGASKIFAEDDDIVPYSATVNPLDWSTANDAGYLPTNLQQYGANPVRGLGLYRGNLWVANTQGSQVWQIDEDPAQMALLDAFPVGTAHHDAISPAFNDLFFLSTLGVRSIGIAGGSTNLQSGDAGMPIDPLVQEAVRNAAINGDQINSLYYPAAGQYWLLFSPPTVPTSPIALSGDLADGVVQAEYSSGPLSVENGFAPFRWSAANLPAGLAMNQFTGIVSGTPTTTGDFSAVVVTVEDRFGRSATSPQSILVSFSSNLLAGNGSDIVVHSGSTSAFNIAQTLPIGGQALGATTSEDGAHLVIIRNGDMSYWQRNILGAYIQVLPFPFSHSPATYGANPQVAMTADSTYLCVTTQSVTYVYKRSGSTWTRIQSLGAINQGNCRWSPSGEYLAVCGGASFGYLTVYRRAGDVLTQVFQVAAASNTGFGLDWASDGLLAWSITNQETRVYTVSGNTVTQISATSPTSPGVSHIRWSGNGQFLYLRGNSSPFFKVYAWNGVQMTAAPAPSVMPTGDAFYIDLSDDGRVLAVSSTTAPILYTTDQGGTLTQLVAPAVVGTVRVVHFTQSSDFS